MTPRSLYDAAYQDLTRGNHGLAILGFQEVLAKFPASTERVSKAHAACVDGV